VKEITKKHECGYTDRSGKGTNADQVIKSINADQVIKNINVDPVMEKHEC